MMISKSRISNNLSSSQRSKNQGYKKSISSSSYQRVPKTTAEPFAKEFSFSPRFNLTSLPKFDYIN
ncbi:MAG TPA: hypothetical protein IAC38_00820 [Candidatus Caccovivens faecavium]|nr:hypothetical protein [Candidatus Caccovivens faecavium]